MKNIYKTSDRVDVVRCKECRKNNTEECPISWIESDPFTGEYCIKYYQPTDVDNWYCANGERKDDNE